ncbi:hypothetical protein GCM10017161_42130 [Thalassotalea marina]|uniref:Uncharacterized protein n=1 Tax=Thalassotalea marina TaxID=1673741 RepID=A0A919BS94_9GAMM|nr:hypothetical protein GCM10017161_42130 [Thalassotalea marina]
MKLSQPTNECEGLNLIANSKPDQSVSITDEVDIQFMDGDFLPKDTFWID